MYLKRDSIEGATHAVTETLVSICSKYMKAYCFPSQETIRRLVKERHGIEICLRTLNYILRWLEDHKFIKRTRRHRAGPNGKILFSTTMYELKKKIFIRLNSIKKWIDRVTLPLRVQVRAQYKSRRKNEIYSEASAECGNPVEFPLEGGASRVTSETLPGLR